MDGPTNPAGTIPYPRHRRRCRPRPPTAIPTTADQQIAPPSVGTSREATGPVPPGQRLRGSAGTRPDIAGPNTSGAFDHGQVETNQVRGDAGRPFLDEVDRPQQIRPMVGN